MTVPRATCSAPAPSESGSAPALLLASALSFTMSVPPSTWNAPPLAAAWQQLTFDASTSTEAFSPGRAASATAAPYAASRPSKRLPTTRRLPLTTRTLLSVIPGA